MDNRNRRKYSFISQVLMLFAVSILCLMVIAGLFGDGAKALSTMYQFGSQGLATSTMLQFLLCSAVIVLLKTLFMSEKIIRSMMLLWRMVLLLLSILICMIVFALIFNWFPIDNIYAWTGFLICFGGGFLVSCLFMIIKTKYDNQKYNELLSLYQNQHGDEHDNE